VWAALTGFASERCVLISSAMLLVLLLLVVFLTAVVYVREGENILLLTYSTFVLILPACISLLFSCFFAHIIRPCQAVALSLAIPLILLCIKQTDRMHVLLATILVFPTILVSNISDGLGGGLR
ncbi:hypothetical protein PMAYCL1PPCAC_09992, partial [Pristionchus mayeri]